MQAFSPAATPSRRRPSEEVGLRLVQRLIYRLHDVVRPVEAHAIAPEITGATAKLCDAFREFPFSCGVLYGSLQSSSSGLDDHLDGIERISMNLEPLVVNADGGLPDILCIQIRRESRGNDIEPALGCAGRRKRSILRQRDGQRNIQTAQRVDR